MALHYSTSTYTGKINAHGGAGHECGGAGTVLQRDTDDDTKTLSVDNNNMCTPLDSRVDWSSLTSTHRGQMSFHTWLFDEPGTHTHIFKVISYLNCMLFFFSVQIQWNVPLTYRRLSLKLHNEHSKTCKACDKL